MEFGGKLASAASYNAEKCSGTRCSEPGLSPTGCGAVGMQVSVVGASLQEFRT